MKMWPRCAPRSRGRSAGWRSPLRFRNASSTLRIAIRLHPDLAVEFWLRGRIGRNSFGLVASGQPGDPIAWATHCLCARSTAQRTAPSVHVGQRGMVVEVDRPATLIPGRDVAPERAPARAPRRRFRWDLHRSARLRAWFPQFPPVPKATSPLRIPGHRLEFPPFLGIAPNERPLGALVFLPVTREKS
jgi:hypothetical protein